MFTRITRFTGEPDVRSGMLITAVGLIVALALCSGAIAGERSVTVRYHASDLDSLHLAEKLYERVEQAAVDACTTPGRRSLQRMKAEEKCAAEALQQAIAGTDSQLLSRIHTMRHPATKVAKH